jgi:hypothetical protein
MEKIFFFFAGLILFFVLLFSPALLMGQLGGTARDYFEAANEEATDWHPNASLLYLVGTGDSMHDDGKALLWTYIFQSPADDSLLMVLISLGFPVLSEELYDTIPLLEPLPAEWIDSDQAIEVAEANGGSDWRATYDNDILVATAGRGFYWKDIPRPVWVLAYTDTLTYANSIRIFVDAVTGEYLDTGGLGIEGGDAGMGDLPKTLTISQNYPNPFNPRTTIRYTVPPGEARQVSLEVFDARGKKIALLFSGIREPGTYEVVWDGKDVRGVVVGTGVYLARLASGNEVTLRKMLVIK